MITTDIKTPDANTLVILFLFEYGRDDQEIEISEESQIIVVASFIGRCFFPYSIQRFFLSLRVHQLTSSYYDLKVSTEIPLNMHVELQFPRGKKTSSYWSRTANDLAFRATRIRVFRPTLSLLPYFNIHGCLLQN